MKAAKKGKRHTIINSMLCHPMIKKSREAGEKERSCGVVPAGACPRPDNFGAHLL
jgi:hypothetical protein